MRNYDTTLIFSPLVEESSLNDMLQQLASFVQAKGGILGNQHMKGKRPLLAPIGKHQEGYLATLSFSMLPEHLEEFTKYCTEQKDILRFLVAKHRQHKKNTQPTIAKARPVLQPDTLAVEQASPTAPVPETQSAKKEEKIDLKDIDEKLEEIFKEQ